MSPSEAEGFPPEPELDLGLPQREEPEPETPLRERVDKALQASMDRCARCQACDNQVDAVMGVLLAVLAERGVLPGDPVPAADEEPPLPEGEFGRIDLPGYRNHTGWVAEETRFGVQVAVVRDWNSHVLAEVAMGPGCQFVHLPTPLRRPEPAAITSGDPRPASMLQPVTFGGDEDGDFDERGCGCAPGFTCQDCHDSGVF